MQDFSKTYTSNTLFPLFKNRLLDKSRPEYAEYLTWLGLSSESTTDMDEPIMALIDYDMDESDHSISINNDISYMYRYPDLTPHVLFLYKMMETSISKDLIDEVLYIAKYDAVKKALEERYDVPNKDKNTPSMN